MTTAIKIPSIQRMILAAVLLISSGAWAGGFTIIEMGSKKTGMMTSVANPDDLSAVYHNAAGLADQHGTRIHLSSGLSIVDASIRLRAWPTGEEVPHGSDQYIATPVDADGFFEGTIKPTKYFGVMPMFAASSDFGFKEGPVVAIAVYVPDFIGAFLPEDAPSRYMIVEGFFVAGVSSLSVGYRLPGAWSFLAVGGSAGVLYVRQEGNRWVNFPTIGNLNADVIIDFSGEDYRPYWNLGVTVDLPGRLRLGLSTIGGADVDLEGKLNLSQPAGQDDPILGSLDIFGRYDMHATMQIPLALNTGLSWNVLPELELAADFRYWFYQVYEKQEIFHNIEFDVLGEPAVPNPLVTPRNYEGSWQVSVGGMWRPFEQPLDFMAGWSYDHSPCPMNTKNLDSPSVDLTGFSLGVRYLLADMWRLSATYYRYWYLRSETTDSILDPPQNAEFWGTVDTFSLQMEVIM